MKKGDLRNCDHCETEYRVKKKGHKFCSSSCRVKAHRIEKGEKELPDFNKLQEKAETRLKNARIGQAIAQGIQQPKIETTYTTPQQEPTNNYEKLLMKKALLIQQREQLLKDGLPIIGGIGGGVIGLRASKGQETNVRFLSTVIGSIFGYKLVKIARKDKSQRDLIQAEQLTIKIQAIDEILNKFEYTPFKEQVVQKVKKVNEKSVLSADEYKDLEIEVLELNQPYKYLLGNPRKNFYKIVTGKPGNGKTTYAIKFATYFAKHHGNVLYIQAEQPNENADFQKALVTHKAEGFDIERRAYNLDLEGLEQYMKNYDLIILDSVNRMKLKGEDLEGLNRTNKTCGILAIMQTNKEGNFKGGQEYLHDCDIFINIENFIAHQTKSRSSLPAQIEV